MLILAKNLTYIILCPFLGNSTTPDIATKERAELNDEWIGERLQGDHRGQRK